MRYLILVTCMLLGTALPAAAQAEIGFYPADFSIGIGVGLPAYPNMVPIPGYPVYYAPGVHSNLFYYHGQYWLFQGGNWYASGWGNGPWQYVPPYAVPPYLLRVPIRYYASPPPFFFGWDRHQAPHWGDFDGHRDFDRAPHFARNPGFMGRGDHDDHDR